MTMETSIYGKNESQLNSTVLYAERQIAEHGDHKEHAADHATSSRRQSGFLRSKSSEVLLKCWRKKRLEHGNLN